MDFVQFQTDLGLDVPSERRANDTGAEDIQSGLVVAHCDCEIFGDIVHQDFQGVLGANILLRVQDLVDEDTAIAEGEILWISRTKELDNHLQKFFACKFRAWHIIEHGFAMLFIKSLALGNSFLVCILQLEPPVGFELLQG